MNAIKIERERWT